MIMTPGMTGPMREMARKERLVERDILHRMNVLPRLAGEHAIHQQERIPVRQLPHDRFDIHLEGFRHHRSFSPNRRKCATMRRHARVGTVGMPLE